ncbi:Mss4-like protein [Pelagophyceae sp. CCMP2097]|nr:Mss4-like protein [Pelagophyceae sp. CCMP2097]
MLLGLLMLLTARLGRSLCVPGGLARRATMQKALPTDDEGWRAVLSPNQFAVLREKGTEPSGYSEQKEGELEFELKKTYDTKYPDQGAYDCVGCGAPLYYARHKFDSGCGWPAYYDGVPGAIKEIADSDGRRIEIVCANCEGHLGHVFKGEGFPSPTDARHCVNGISLRYNAAGEQPDDIKKI